MGTQRFEAANSTLAKVADLLAPSIRGIIVIIIAVRVVVPNDLGPVVAGRAPRKSAAKPLDASNLAGGVPAQGRRRHDERVVSVGSLLSEGPEDGHLAQATLAPSWLSERQRRLVAPWEFADPRRIANGLQNLLSVRPGCGGGDALEEGDGVSSLLIAGPRVCLS